MFVFMFLACFSFTFYHLEMDHSYKKPGLGDLVTCYISPFDSCQQLAVTTVSNFDFFSIPDFFRVLHLRFH